MLKSYGILNLGNLKEELINKTNFGVANDLLRSRSGMVKSFASGSSDNGARHSLSILDFKPLFCMVPFASSEVIDLSRLSDLRPLAFHFCINNSL